MARHCFAAYLSILLLMVAASNPTWSKPTDEARPEAREARRDYGRAMEAFDQFDQQMKSKEYEAALATLTQLVEIKGRLNKASLPNVISRTVSEWDQRLHDNAKALAGAGVNLPESLSGLTKPIPRKEPAARPGGRPRNKVAVDILGGQGVVVDGVRQIAEFEADVYGPSPFPELVWDFVDEEISLLLERQQEDGSIAMLNRKTEAGGTVECVIMASMCGCSLRKHADVDLERIEPAIARSLDYVLYMVRSGKLRSNVTDAAWRYIYAFRFLVHEYPFVRDEKKKVLIEDACQLIFYELADMQQWTPVEKAKPVDLAMLSTPGMYVEDDEATGLALVTECPDDCPAYKAGIREGDILVTANGKPVRTTLRYYINQMSWVGGTCVEFAVKRDGKELSFKVDLPYRYPGSLGLSYDDIDDGGVAVADFDSLSNPTHAPIKIGDRILRVNEQAISRVADIEGLTVYSGQEVNLEIERDGKKEVVDLMCVPLQAADFGVGISGGTDFSTIDGLAIGQFRGNSCLEAVGLRSGDRLLRIDDTRIMNRRHFQDFERSIWGGKTVAVTYLGAANQRVATVEVTTGSRPHEEWLKKGLHGVTLAASRNEGGVMVSKVSPGSPSDKAGCQVGDVVLQVNGVDNPRLGDAQILIDVFSGTKCLMKVSREGETVDLEWTAHRPSSSAWYAGKPIKNGGWVYYKNVRGGTTFMTSDMLRALVRSRDMPLEMPSQLIEGSFNVLSKLRMKQPNSDVESYRYDAGGSFWNVQDIRGDVGRLNAAELACVMYCDAEFPHADEMHRTQANLKATLAEWIKWRAIMDLQKTGLHGKLSIAPYYFPYSHATTLEAAEYFTKDDELKELVSETALKAFMKYIHIEHFDALGRDSWKIGYYPRVTLLRTCLLMDGLGTVKHLYRPRVTVQHPDLKEAMAKFNARQYGEAFTLLQAIPDEAKLSDADLSAEIKKLEEAIGLRYATRINEIKEIHKKYYRDAIRYLQETKPHFKGYPDADEIDELLVSWESGIPKATGTE